MSGGGSRPLGVPARFALALFAASVVAELLRHFSGPGLELARYALSPWLRVYEVCRAWVLAHPELAGSLLLAALVLGVLFARQLLQLYAKVRSIILGADLSPVDAQPLPRHPVDLVAAVRDRPLGSLFLGVVPTRRWFRWHFAPLYLKGSQRGRHRHILGKTGSGKTQSVLLPLALQDVLDGRDLAFLDPKGSAENLRAIAAIAALAKRGEQLRVFRLPAWNEPSIPSHTYNMVYVRPRGPGDRGGDPVAMVERVFPALNLGDNAYYNTQAQTMFLALARVLHGMLDESGRGIPFNRLDLLVCLKAIGGPAAWQAALDHVLARTTARDAAEDVTSQVTRLGKDAPKAFTGLIAALETFASPLVDAYAPDLVLEDVLSQGMLFYAQLPANLFPAQAGALGRIFLNELKQIGARRQVFRGPRAEVPLSLVVDEFADFADDGFVSALNKLRDARVEISIAHQSLGDLRVVGNEFAESVWDNTPLKVLLKQDNPQLAEMVAKSIGTKAVIELTVRRQEGPLLTSLPTGDASSKLVEAFKLHPNQLKNLATAGQGFVYDGESVSPVVFGMFPPGLAAEPTLVPRDQSRARGLRLWERFVGARQQASAGRSSSPTAAPASSPAADRQLIAGWEQKGAEHLSAGRFAEAVVAYEQACLLQANPPAPLLFQLACAHEGAGALPRAKEFYIRASRAAGGPDAQQAAAAALSRLAAGTPVAAAVGTSDTYPWRRRGGSL